LSYKLTRSTPVTLTVYNLLGQQIAVLVDRPQQAGSYSVAWNGRNSADQAVASGIYLYSLKTREGIKTQKMMLLK
ncbi:MAG: FlgD immunoglobulin-like domain containing protein, partial [Calditrichota bacterium]